MGWLYLALAVALEVVGTTCMKLSDGFARPLPSVLVFLFYIGCVAALILAVKRVDIGTAYAVWSGVGTAAITAIGIGFFAEPATAGKLGCIGLIVAGVIGLYAQAA